MKNLTISLHEDLIVEILLRLQVSSLLRFKCVCKSWLSLICSSQFAKSHFDLAAVPSNRILIPKKSYFFDDFIDSKDLRDESIVALLLPTPPVTRARVIFWGSCRGFVLLHYSDIPIKDTNRSFITHLIVWNPSTGEHKQVPHSSMMREYMYGFGYDALTDDYLVIHLYGESEYRYDSEYKDKTQFKFFSVKTNSWKYLQDPYQGKFYWSKPGLLLNGALHWLANDSSSFVFVIVAFDLGQRNLSEIPLPIDSTQTWDVELYTIGECLVVFCRFWEISELWVMKEYNVKSSWTRLFASPVCINNGVLFKSNLFPPRPEGIAGKIFECCLILEQYQGEIYGRSYCCRRLEMSNTEGEINQRGICEHLAFGEGLVLYNKPLWHAMYRESLLSLPSDSGSQDHQP